MLDLDATDDPLHGKQEGRFFHGYYGHYCYLPLYVFASDHLLCARLRTANQHGSAGSRQEAERIVEQLRQRWPAVKIILRADSRFCREELMHWCEEHGVDYVFGLARKSRLQEMLSHAMTEARQRYEATGQPTRVFYEGAYQRRETWSCARRVVGKAEHLDKGANPRFVVTSLAAERWEARALYEELYCARGEMENRVKEQFQLFADRTSTHGLWSNQLRLTFSAFAYVLIDTLRRIGLPGTEMAQAEGQTISGCVYSRSEPWCASVCGRSGSHWPAPIPQRHCLLTPTPRCAVETISAAQKAADCSLTTVSAPRRSRPRCACSPSFPSPFW